MNERKKSPFDGRDEKLAEYAGGIVEQTRVFCSKVKEILNMEITLFDSKTQLGLKDRLVEFKKSLVGLTDFQKFLLITIAMVVPAGMFISAALVGVLTKKR